MTYELNAALSLSIGFAAVISWVRFKKTDPAFLPFTLFVTCGLVNELISIALMQAGYYNAVNYNLYALAEALLLTWQFRRWGLFARRWLYLSLQVLYVVSFWIEWLLKFNAMVFLSYFLILHSFAIVLMSITQINRLLFSVYKSILTHPQFLICMALVVFFTYMILVEAFWVYGLNRSTPFRLRIYEILAYVNLFTNLLFAFASLCTPLKLRYIMRS